MRSGSGDHLNDCGGDGAVGDGSRSELVVHCHVQGVQSGGQLERHRGVESRRAKRGGGGRPLRAVGEGIGQRSVALGVGPTHGLQGVAVDQCLRVTSIVE